MKQSPIKIIHLEYSGGCNFVIRGRKVCSVKSSPQRSDANFSGQPGNWSEYNLYRSLAGQFVCERIEHARGKDQKDIQGAKVCDDRSKVIEFFGDGWLAQALYEKADIAPVPTGA